MDASIFTISRCYAKVVIATRFTGGNLSSMYVSAVSLTHPPVQAVPALRSVGNNCPSVPCHCYNELLLKSVKRQHVSI